MIDSQLLAILVCPVTKAPLQLSKDKSELICTVSRLAYPIRDDIPVLLAEDARQLSLDEYESYQPKKG